MRSKTIIVAISAVLLALALFLSPPNPSYAAAASDASLAAWDAIYWYRALGDPDDAGVNFGADVRGNTTVGDVVLMPLPDAPGDGTPASIDVTLDSGESFFLPLWTQLGTSYTDGTPPDEFFSLKVFKTLDITFKIDGVPVINNGNVLDYYAKDEFDPEVPIDFPPYDAVIWFQGISILHAPLSPGKHTLTLDVKNVIPVFGGVAEYHNTWNLKVVKAK
jgi:hypothetical protein